MIAVAHVMEDFAVRSTPVEPASIESQVPEARLPESPEEFSAHLAAALRRRIGEDRFDLWFDRKVRFTLAGNTVVVEAAHTFAVNWIAGKFRDDLLAVAAAVIGRSVELAVRMREELAPAAPSRLPELSPAMPRAFAPSTAGPGPALNPTHTLDTFVVGPSNQMAYHAALRVAEQPGRQFNPLFIHGHCGLGKTHLLQGICHRFARHHPGKKWLYLTGEQFTNDYLEAIRHHKTDAFRRRIRNTQLLVIDDVHFLSNKKATQEEFLHTFDHIDAGGCQVVLASDCQPREIEALSQQLTSRFVSGMVLRVDSPDQPTRLEILRRRVARQGWSVSETVLAHIARAPASSVRELEGLLLQAVAGMHLIAAGREADAGPLLACLRERTSISGPIPAARIAAATAQYFSIPEQDLLGAGRDKTTTTARAVAMFLARRHTGMSFPEIGRALGGRNHSTVIAACQRVEAMLGAGTLLCWNTPAGARHQAIADVLHELEAAIRRVR